MYIKIITIKIPYLKLVLFNAQYHFLHVHKYFMSKMHTASFTIMQLCSQKPKLVFSNFDTELFQSIKRKKNTSVMEPSINIHKQEYKKNFKINSYKCSL